MHKMDSSSDSISRSLIWWRFFWDHIIINVCTEKFDFEVYLPEAWCSNPFSATASHYFARSFHVVLKLLPSLSLGRVLHSCSDTHVMNEYIYLENIEIMLVFHWSWLSRRRGRGEASEPHCSNGCGWPSIWSIAPTQCSPYSFSTKLCIHTTQSESTLRRSTFVVYC